MKMRHSAKVDVEKKGGIEDSTFDTHSNPEITRDYTGFAMDILAQKEKGKQSSDGKKCSKCGTGDVKLYSNRRSAVQVCVACLWPRTREAEATDLPKRDGIEKPPQGRSTGKVVRLYRCFHCENTYPAADMSTCLFFCRVCLGSQSVRTPKERVRNAERALRRVGEFVRRRVCI